MSSVCHSKEQDNLFRRKVEIQFYPITCASPIYNLDLRSHTILLFFMWSLILYKIIVSFHFHVLFLVINHYVTGIARDRRGRDRMVVGFTTTYAIGAYHHWCCEFEYCSGWGVQHYVIKFVSDLRQFDGYLQVLRFPPPINLAATT